MRRAASDAIMRRATLEDPMPGHRILVVYGTTHGHAAKVARRLADRFLALGEESVLANADHLPASVNPREFHAVVVGSSVTCGRHQRCVADFVAAHRDVLEERANAFFSVSGSAAGHADGDLAKARAYVDEFVCATGWRPTRTALVAGAIAYARYNPLLRWVIRRIAAKSGAPTDTSRDHEFTDWGAVDRFADAIEESLAPPAVLAEPATA